MDKHDPSMGNVPHDGRDPLPGAPDQALKRKWPHEVLDYTVVTSSKRKANSKAEIYDYAFVDRDGFGIPIPVHHRGVEN